MLAAVVAPWFTALAFWSDPELQLLVEVWFGRTSKAVREVDAFSDEVKMLATVAILDS